MSDAFIDHSGDLALLFFVAPMNKGTASISTKKTRRDFPRPGIRFLLRCSVVWTAGILCLFHEFSQSIDELLRLFPRNAMAGVGIDADLCAWHPVLRARRRVAGFRLVFAGGPV